MRKLITRIIEILRCDHAETIESVPFRRGTEEERWEDEMEGVALVSVSCAQCGVWLRDIEVRSGYTETAF